MRYWAARQPATRKSMLSKHSFLSSSQSWSLLFLLLLSSCEQKQTTLAWNKSMFQMGSQSSPRAADLNQDGILEIVMGGAKGELDQVENGVFALDGRTGEQLWSHAADAQMVGSATFQDITGDGIPDVFIGGRKHNLKSIDGKTGALIWEYDYRYPEDPVLKFARFNFYNTVLVPDQSGDQLPDLLAVNGGNWDAAPDSTQDRYPGVLMLFDSKNGQIIAADTVPDGGESYLSPVAFQSPGADDLTIVFGTGGETIAGNLYAAQLADLLRGDLSKASLIGTEKGHGFIAPPVVVDLTGDRIPDIVAISHAGRILAVDGQSQRIIWEATFTDMESSNAPAVGFFNGDEVPDLVAVLSRGKWPHYTRAMKVVLDGRDGTLIYQDTSGCFEIASPVVYDLNKDGYEEIIFSSNQYDCHQAFSEDLPAPKTITNHLLAIDIRTSSTRIIDASEGFKNIYSTPWIGDLDKDGYLDFVYCQYINNLDDFSNLRGMRIRRISSHIRIKKPPKWGGYMGTDGTGILSW